MKPREIIFTAFVAYLCLLLTLGMILTGDWASLRKMWRLDGGAA